MERAERYAALNKARLVLNEIAAEHTVESGFWGGRIAETLDRANGGLFEVLNALDSFTGDVEAREAMDAYQWLMRGEASDDQIEPARQVHTTWKDD